MNGRDQRKRGLNTSDRRRKRRAVEEKLNHWRDDGVTTPEIQNDVGKCDFLLFVMFSHSKLSKIIFNVKKNPRKCYNPRKQRAKLDWAVAQETEKCSRMPYPLPIHSFFPPFSTDAGWPKKPRTARKEWVSSIEPPHQRSKNIGKPRFFSFFCK